MMYQLNDQINEMYLQERQLVNYWTRKSIFEKIIKNRFDYYGIIED
jgi:hypothetical protein